MRQPVLFWRAPVWCERSGRVPLTQPLRSAQGRAVEGLDAKKSGKVKQLLEFAGDNTIRQTSSKRRAKLKGVQDRITFI